jgi:hypothetical protein
MIIFIIFLLVFNHLSLSHLNIKILIYFIFIVGGWYSNDAIENVEMKCLIQQQMNGKL